MGSHDSGKQSVGRGIRLGSLALGLLTCLAGCAYALTQYRSQSTVADSAFVTLLSAASLFVALLGRRLLRNFIRDSSDLIASSRDVSMATLKGSFHNDLEKIASIRRALALGTGYGACLGAAPWILNVWPDDTASRVSLGVFMLAANFLTGFLLSPLAQVFRWIVGLGRVTPISLWQHGRRAVSFVSKYAQQISLTAAAYIALCIGGIPFSRFPVSDLVIAYAVFAGTAFVLISVLPQIPISLRIHAEKQKALRLVEARIRVHFQRFEEADGETATAVLSGLDRLFDLKKKIEDVSIVPYFFRSVGTVVSIGLVMTWPTLVERTILAVVNGVRILVAAN